MSDIFLLLTEVDLAILGILFLSGAFAYIRGFSWEITHLLSWVLTLVAVWYLGWSASPWINHFIVSGMNIQLPYFIIVGITSTLVFVGMTMLLGGLTSFVMKGSLNMRLGFIDRFLGFCYGTLRAFILLVIIFLVYTYFTPEPEFFREARFYDSIRMTTDFILNLLPSMGSDG